jgi:predicted transcriptional regulator
MDTQNITLSISKDVLQKVKIIAVKRGTSVSALMTGLLENLVDREEGYQAARRRHLETFKTDRFLGSKGTVTWSRKDLHKR